MKTKFEIVTIHNMEVTVDVSMLIKTDELFFNATQMAKHFGKRPDDFLRLESTKEYIEEILKEEDSRYGISRNEELIRTTRGGKYQGTWLHNELAFEFAGWCSALFRRQLHKWAEHRIQQEHEWKQKRLEARTGYAPMTNAIQRAHEEPKPYHFSNEANLINRVVLGMDARAYCDLHEVPTVRDGVSAFELSEINRLQTINAGLIEVGMDYEQRKTALEECHSKELNLIDWEDAA